MAFSSSKIVGTGRCGSDWRENKRASRALIESRDKDVNGLVPKIFLSTVIR